MDGQWHPVEVYSTFLRIRGYLEVYPGQRLTDEVNRLEDYLQLRNTVTEPLLSSYPVVSPQETNTSIAKGSVVMVVPANPESPTEGANPVLRRPTVRHHVILNTSAFALSADLHLEPHITLLTRLQQGHSEFLPVTRVSAVLVASLGGTPHTVQQPFALVNPASIVSFSVREAES
jgi:hypothetical protein